VKFFYNKQRYLLDRYKEIHAECLNREFEVSDYSEAWDGLDGPGFEWCWNGWSETAEAAEITSARINERLELPDGFREWRRYENMIKRIKKMGVLTEISK
jgi:hypothetical protein